MDEKRKKLSFESRNNRNHHESSRSHRASPQNIITTDSLKFTNRRSESVPPLSVIH